MSTPPRLWREQPQRYRYEAVICDHCGYLAFPPRVVCPACHGREWTKTTLEEEGKILSFTVIHTPPADFKDEAPYVNAIVELDDGARLTGQVVDLPPEELAIGTRVRIEFRRVNSTGHAGVIAYGYKFAPA
ncbi:MAG: Zn-ribbon domain-containing OB-fold protein [Planctomycetota bacterium]